MAKTPLTRTHARNHGQGQNRGGPADGDLARVGTRGWISNPMHSLTDQYLQQVGPIQFGRVAEVYTTTKTVEITFTGGRGRAAYGAAPYFPAGGSLETPNPGDTCIVWNPPTGTPVLLAHWPPPGDQGAIPYDVEYCGVSALSEERHSSAVNAGNEIIGQHNSGRPQDLLGGDWGYMTHQGVTFALLGDVALLKATPMAQLQLSTLDDSVRLMSRVFEHWFVGGCHSIQVDRTEVNLEFSFTKFLSEALGRDELGEKISREGEEDEFFEVVQEEDAVPKERVQFQLGHNADLLHLFVTKPVVGESLLSNGTAPVGVAEFYTGADGAVSLRSAKSVSISKVSRIRVPKRKAPPWEQKPSTRPETPQFAFDDANPEGRHLATPTDIAYRRETKEVGGYLERNDFHPVPPTAEVQAPLAEDGEEDYREEEVTFELRDDGSAIIGNSSGSSIEMTAGGDIRIHAARDLFIESGRHTRVFSGSDYTNRARKHIEFASSEEDFRVKAQKNLHLVSVEQGIVIETFSSGTPGEADSLLDQSSAGITIRSNAESPLYLESKQDKILLTSELETALRVVSPSEKFYLEGAHLQVNLIRGAELIEMGGSTMQVNLDQGYELICSRAGIACEGSFILETLGNTSISTFGSASWSQPGNDVQVAHRHPLEEWTHVVDSDGSRLGHGVLIEKTAVAVDPGVSPFEPSTFDQEAAPHTPEAMANAVVGFRNDDEYPPEKWYQTLWQKKLEEKGQGVKWDLLANDRRTAGGKITAPYPGVTFDERFAYTDPEPGSGAAGDYPMQSLVDYTVVE